MHDSVLVDRDDRGVARITMHRPERHNAFDAAMIGGLEAAVERLESDPSIRAIVLTGSGPSFCSGADLAHMRSMLVSTEQANFEDALALAKLLHRLAECDRPLIARVNGNAFGGAIGLVACADIAVAVEGARFALSEVRLGLVPATISPFVVDAIGARQTRRLTLTGERFDAGAAREFGLVHVVATAQELDTEVDRQIAYVLAGAPHAQQEAKRLYRRLRGLDRRARDERELYTARLLAQLRVGEEAQEGMSAFLEKREPRWSRS
jgi:methylglutaconyl-CoA hydratase